MSRLMFFAMVLTLLSSRLSAQQRLFTNKEGVQLYAEIISVYPDWSKMTILKDGKNFTIEPKVLILDDQQYIKDWLKERGITAPLSGSAPTVPNGDGSLTTSSPVAAKIDPSTIRINVELKRKQVNSERRKLDSYTRLDSKKLVFDIELNSVSREPVPPISVSYAVVWKDVVAFTSLSYVSNLPGTEMAEKGQMDFAQLVYNTGAVFTTEPVELHTVAYDGNEHYLEDELLGVLVRVSLKDGTVLLDHINTEAKAAKLTWDGVAKLTGTSDLERVLRADKDDSGDEKFLNLQLKKGQSEEGPINVANKKISISALVTPDIKSQDGVVVAIGGSEVGLSIYVKSRQVYGSVSTPEGVKWVAKPIPLGTFEVKLELTQKGLSLESGGGSPAARADANLFSRDSVEGIDVGKDTGLLAGEYPANFDFAGGIENLRISIRE